MYGLYNKTPEGIKEQTLAEFQAANPDMDTGTPEEQDMALNQALAGYYKDYGTIISRPQAQVLSEVKAYAKKNGISLSQALKENFVDPLQAKGDFKAMKDKAL
jgi:hypothetical protein